MSEECKECLIFENQPGLKRDHFLCRDPYFYIYEELLGASAKEVVLGHCTSVIVFSPDQEVPIHFFFTTTHSFSK